VQVFSVNWFRGGFIPEEDMGYFFVNVQLPDAASLQRTDEITKEVETILMDFKEVEYVTTATGYSILSGAMTSNTGVIYFVTNWADRDLTAEKLILL